MDEMWLDVSDVIAAVGISKQAIHKRLGSFVTRTVKGLGHAGQRLQLLLSSLPEPWQAAYRARRAKAEPNLLPAPVPSFAGAVPAPLTPLEGAGSVATDSPLAVAAASSSRALAPVAAPDDTLYIDDGPDALHMLWELAAGHVAGQRRFSFKLKNL